MSRLRTSRDFLRDEERLPATVDRSGRPMAGPHSTDAELYRIIVAKAIHEGRFASKADFDAAVRLLGTVELADEIIAFTRLRPGCGAWRHGDRMICECGVSWAIDVADPPLCRS